VISQLLGFPGRSLWARGYAATTDIDRLDDMVRELLADNALSSQEDVEETSED